MKIFQNHYSEVTRASWLLRSLATKLFLKQLVQASKKTSKLHIIGPLLKELSQGSVDSSHKEPVMWKVFPCHYIITIPSPVSSHRTWVDMAVCCRAPGRWQVWQPRHSSSPPLVAGYACSEPRSPSHLVSQIDGLVQERRNSIALAMIKYQWISASLWWLQCFSNGVTMVLPYVLFCSNLDTMQIYSQVPLYNAVTIMVWYCIQHSIDWSRI